MNLSVESRVAAHISTPYIDADGRGTRETFSSAFALCMQSPEVFREEEKGARTDATTLARLESGVVATAERTAMRADAIRQLGRLGIIETNAADAPQHAAATDERGERRGAERAEVKRQQYVLYQRRNEGPDAQAAFDESLKPTTESVLRDREEGISRRHAHLEALRRQARRCQEEAAQGQAARRAAAQEAFEQLMLAKVTAEHAAEAERLREERVAEVERIARERERDAQLRRVEEDVRMQRERRFLAWSKDREDAARRAHEASAAATAAEEAMHEAHQLATAAQHTTAYDTLKAAHARLEALTRSVGDALKRIEHKGSAFGLLVEAARDVAIKRHCIFRGLKRVCKGSYVPTVYTPLVLPQPDQPLVTVGCQTNVSEPIRPSTNSRDSRRQSTRRSSVAM